MTTESKNQACKFCGSPWHRGWQCRDNPKNIQRMEKARSMPKQSPELSLRTSKRRSKSQGGSVRPKLIKKYDELFSKYLRLKAQKNGNLYCYTCGRRLSYDTAVVMHFYSRRYVSIRFDEDNVHIGCRKCNTPDKDQSAVLQRYAELLGMEIVERLTAKKNSRISTPELELEYNRCKESYSLLLKEMDSQ